MSMQSRNIRHVATLIFSRRKPHVMRVYGGTSGCDVAQYDSLAQYVKKWWSPARRSMNKCDAHVIRITSFYGRDIHCARRVFVELLRVSLDKRGDAYVTRESHVTCDNFNALNELCVDVKSPDFSVEGALIFVDAAIFL